MFQLIIRPERLLHRVDAIQVSERRSLARSEKTDKKHVSERLWLQYKTRLDAIKERQKEERFALVKDRETHLRTIVTFDLAKGSFAQTSCRQTIAGKFKTRARHTQLKSLTRR